MIAQIIGTLREQEYYGKEYKHINLAKGKNEIVTTWKGAKQKIKRLWLQRKN